MKETLGIGENTLPLNTTSLINGTYIVEVTTETKTQRVRIVVMK